MLILLTLPGVLFAQNKERKGFWQKTGEWFQGTPYQGEMPLYTTHTKLLLGAGAVGLEDGYLSETAHSGPLFSIKSLTDFALRSDRDKWHVYQEAEILGGFPENPANKAPLYVIGGQYSIGDAWRAFLWHGLSLDLAPMLSASVQGNMKLNNTNNIANVKADFGLDAWARLRYRIPVEAFPMKVQYALRLPVLHGTFSPAYGQSYYEYVAGGDKSVKVKFYPTSLLNSFDIRQHLLIDLPIRHVTVTLGAEHRYQNTRLSNLVYRQGAWMGLLGVSFDLFGLSGNRTHNSPYLKNAIDR